MALLVYPPDEPGEATYYPFAEFSPEWQALRWAMSVNVPVRFMDLPQSHQIALQRQRLEAVKAALEVAQTPDEAASTNGEQADQEASSSTAESAPVWRTDPLTLLAEAAGYQDHELWWEHQVETRRDATDLFTAVAEAMRIVREELPHASERDVVREAFMRRTLRAVRKEKFERIAVVCGAWHVPALEDEALDGRRAGCKIGEDDERLRGLPKVKTTATWIPWTHSRLTFRSGYGAGVHSPDWYAHLWKSPGGAPLRWATAAARLLRDADLDASSASVIEAVRLADALAAMRDLRSPGLVELNEAMLSIFCHGDSAPLRLIRDRLEIGDLLGQVPDDAPSVPLAQDLARLQKSLRLKPSAEVRLFDLDLRNETDLARSRLFHRLNRLGIDWGNFKSSNHKTSTFHELWNVSWKPEYSVKLIEANIWGNTVVTAATAKIVHDVGTAINLAQIIELLEAALKSGLDAAIELITSVLQTRAAVAADVRQLLDAILPLARLARYGDVRGTQAEQVEPLLTGLFERACVGLRPACAALDEEAADRMLTGLSSVTQAVDLLQRAELIRDWFVTLRSLLDTNTHPLLRGWCCRALLEKGVLSDEEVERLASRELSPAGVAAECAAWATGLLRGSGMVLLHQVRIWLIFDRWLRAFNPDAFVEMLPLIRRAFADFAPAERRQMGEKVKRLNDAPSEHRTTSAVSEEVDATRAAQVLPVLAHILGVTP